MSKEPITCSITRHRRRSPEKCLETRQSSPPPQISTCRRIASTATYCNQSPSFWRHTNSLIYWRCNMPHFHQKNTIIPYSIFGSSYFLFTSFTRTLRYLCNPTISHNEVCMTKNQSRSAWVGKNLPELPESQHSETHNYTNYTVQAFACQVLSCAYWHCQTPISIAWISYILTRKLHHEETWLQNLLSSLSFLCGCHCLVYLIP